ncbi:MAG: hypothetical protein DRI65_06000 [Chloroflexota bacterium]|nr:MAG: hypothetical protein DRI65_06000 [Chloroflexota bacterium]HDD62026.1 hypothetical protein [Chloroflexota bacterium]
MDDLEKKTKTLANDLVFELNKSLGFRKDGLAQPFLKPLVWKPMVRFSEMATIFEQRVVQEGWQKASAWFITHFVDKVKTLGAEHLPKEGPLVIAANHPGAYDSLVISSHIPRDDVKIISSDIPFVKKLPDTSKHMIFSSQNVHDRMSAARSALRHLKNGGTLLVFARGTMDPDPAFMTGSEVELTRWTSSLGLFMRNVPQTKLSVSLISGVISPKFINHPATLFRRGRVNKQRLAEFFQVMYQLLVPGRIMVSPNLSFGSPVTLDDLRLEDKKNINKITDGIIIKAQEQFQFHQNNLLAA